jgi:hypothetical protein
MQDNLAFMTRSRWDLSFTIYYLEAASAFGGFYALPLKPKS